MRLLAIRLGLPSHASDDEVAHKINSIIDDRDRLLRERGQLRNRIDAANTAMEEMQGLEESENARSAERMKAITDQVTRYVTDHKTTWNEAWNAVLRSGLAEEVGQLNQAARPTGNNGKGNQPRFPKGNQEAVDTYMAGVRKAMKAGGISFAEAYASEQIRNRAGFEALLRR